MEWFSRSNHSFQFSLFSVNHIAALGIFVLVSAAIFLNRKKLNDQKWRRIEIGTAFSLILIEGMNHVWMHINGVWSFGRSLPLELCNIALILCIFLLMTRRKIFFELMFFIAVLGATQAIITPALTYDFPHFRYFRFFYEHIMVVWAALYFTWVKGYYPSFRSLRKLLIFINLLLPIIFFVNNQADGNYWFLRHKPESPSLFDLLGPYPWYIFTLESVLIALSSITWFIMRKRVKNGERSQMNIGLAKQED